MIVNNIFTQSGTSSKEIVETLLATNAGTMERIVSTGQSTPAGRWLDQDRDEWVILLSGSAGLLFEQDKRACTLKPGDYVYIPAHTRHRVEWTELHTNTVWLAFHMNPGAREQKAT